MYKHAYTQLERFSELVSKRTWLLQTYIKALDGFQGVRISAVCVVKCICGHVISYTLHPDLICVCSKLYVYKYRAGSLDANQHDIHAYTYMYTYTDMQMHTPIRCGSIPTRRTRTWKRGAHRRRGWPACGSRQNTPSCVTASVTNSRGGGWRRARFSTQCTRCRRIGSTAWCGVRVHTCVRTGMRGHVDIVVCLSRVAAVSVVPHGAVSVCTHACVQARVDAWT